MFLFGFVLSLSVEVGKSVEFLHNGIGTVVHPSTVIRNRVTICQTVTIGDGTAWNGYDSDGRLILRYCL